MTDIDQMDAQTLRHAIDTALGYTGIRRTLAYLTRIEEQVYHDGGWTTLPDWPNDIAAAWGLVDRMHAAGWNVTVDVQGPGVVVSAWNISSWVNDSIKDAATVDDTAPLAICRLFLLWTEANHE